MTTKEKMRLVRQAHKELIRARIDLAAAGYQKEAEAIEAISLRAARITIDLAKEVEQEGKK